MSIPAMRIPSEYESWYHTTRGAWIGNTEFSLLLSLLRPMACTTLLDVGCGTGWFTRRFALAGLQVTGLDPDPVAIEFARMQRDGDASYITGDANELPFPDRAFDCCAAITSLCFVADPGGTVREMWRASRRGVVLGLLNRHSLLHRQKAGSRSYSGARWDTAHDIREWFEGLQPVPRIKTRYCIFLPDGNRIERIAEYLIPQRLPLGGFLAVSLTRAG